VLYSLSEQLQILEITKKFNVSRDDLTASRGSYDMVYKELLQSTSLQTTKSEVQQLNQELRTIRQEKQPIHTSD
jgi:hypothetical protein